MSRALMETSLIVALIGLLATGVTVLGVVVGHTIARLNALDEQLQAQRDYNRRLWVYLRRLLDLYYRHRAAGSPDPDPIPEEE